jgi:hypothetical protein
MHRKEENEAFNKETGFPAEWSGTPLNIYFLINPTPPLPFFLQQFLFVSMKFYIYSSALCMLLVCRSRMDVDLSL